MSHEEQDMRARRERFALAFVKALVVDLGEEDPEELTDLIMDFVNALLKRLDLPHEVAAPLPLPLDDRD